MRILIADTEMKHSEMLRNFLKHHKYTVDTVNTGEDTLFYALSLKYDAILLNINLPDQSGFDIVKELRRQNSATPILLLTVKNNLNECITGLDLGADDYLTKPLLLPVLLSRIRVLIRRSEHYTADENDIFTRCFPSYFLSNNALRCVESRIMLRIPSISSVSNMVLSS